MNARASHMSDVPAIPQRPAILIVEDELILAKDLQRTLIDFGYDAFAIATSAKSALRCARERCPDLVLMDIRIKGPKDGIETAGLLTKQFSTALIYLTAHADTAMIKRAKETEPHGYLLKPINTVELHTAVEIALHKHRLEQARAAVNESNELFHTMIEAVKDYAIFMLEVDGRVASWNIGAERLKGYSREEIVGQHFSKFYTADAIAAHKPMRELETARHQGRSEDQDWRVRKDGTQFFANVVITAVYDSSGKLRGFTKVTRDVTAPQKYEESLRQARREAECANAAKSLFLANMSHEIRTPMNAVIGLTHLLEQTSLQSEQSELVGQIKVAGKSLLAVITDVLDLLKIEAGELTISKVAFTPGRLLKEVLAVMRVAADRKGITLQLDVPDELPAALEGDAARLTQILTNLLSNAVKFTEHGGVTLCVRVLASTSAGSALSFTVRDTGIGIDPAAQARLFAPFVQADESIARRYGGTGLGLSIINSLCKLMGGTIDFTSTVGVGSEFRVVLEFSSASATSPVADLPASVSRVGRPIAGVRVLLVDDYELNLVVAKGILEQAGALVWIANNGHAAIEHLGLHASEFDVVLMDIQMPIMDGYEATRRIRHDLGLMKLPVIALTAGAFSSEQRRATLAGMNDLIVKPFDPRALISSVIRHTAGAAVAAQIFDLESTAPTGRVAWTPIEGIDLEATRNHLDDDPVLSRSLLLRFLADFADVTASPSQRLFAGVAEQSNRLHKLKGGAGVLGAKSIQHLAAEAEAACVAGDAARADRLFIELGRHLDALRSSAALAFEDAQSERIDAPPSNRRRRVFKGKCHVLLVDDDDIVRAHVANVLEQSGYRIGEATCGEDALRALRRSDYQVVMTDWKMCGMSGLELCRALRSGIETRDLYLVILTMSDGQQDADLCFAAGADAYLLKGAPNDEIIRQMDVAQHIMQSRSALREPPSEK